MIPHNISGAGWERMFFGCTATDFPKPDRMSWTKSIEKAAEEQYIYGWDPKSPKTSVAMSLFLNVQNRVNKDFSEQLELYCSIGTSLDWFHGTDGFFRIGKYIVAFDLTSNSDKALLKSDVVIIYSGHVLGRKIGAPCKKIAKIFNSNFRVLRSMEPNSLVTVT